MLNALLYLQYHSFRNRAMIRLKRLKQPKYLIGAIAGLLYFWFYFIRYAFLPNPPGATPGLPSAGGLSESIAAVALMVIVAGAWILPKKRAALAFTEAEVAFLFPAPVSRTWLVHFKLLRSQTGIFVSTLLLALLSQRAGGHFLQHAIGWWTVLSMLNLHFLGASFARTMLLDHGITTLKRRVLVLTLLGLIVAGSLWWMWDGLPPFPPEAMGDLRGMSRHLQAIVESAPLAWFLEPFHWAVAPYFAPDFKTFALAMAPALALLVAHYWWVIRSDVAFEEASVEASRALAEKMAAARSGNWQQASGKVKPAKPPFDLAATGWPAIGFAWKNMIAARGVMNMRLWIVLFAMGVGLLIGMSQTGRGGSLAAFVMLILGVIFIWTLILGPQFLRQDFRQDLQVIDVLKSYPLPGWQVALGQVLGPGLIMAMMHWALIGLAFGVSMAFPAGPGLGWRVAAALAAAIVLPLLDVIAIQVPNLSVLLFPAWFQLGKEPAQGIEATGQRIVLLLGQMLVFLVALAPAAGVFFLVFLVVDYVAVTPVAIVAGAFVGALLLAAEAALGVMLLGKLYERFEPGEQMA